MLAVFVVTEPKVVPNTLLETLALVRTRAFDLGKTAWLLVWLWPGRWAGVRRRLLVGGDPACPSTGQTFEETLLWAGMDMLLL